MDQLLWFNLICGLYTYPWCTEKLSTCAFTLHWQGGTFGSEWPRETKHSLTKKIKYLIAASRTRVAHTHLGQTQRQQRRKPLASVRAPGFQNCFNKSLHLLGKSVPRFMVSLGVIHNFKVEPDPSLTRNNDIFCFVWSQHHRYQLLLNIVTQGNPHLHFVYNLKKILFHQHLHIVSAGGFPSRHHCCIGQHVQRDNVIQYTHSNLLLGQKKSTLWAAYISRNTRQDLLGAWRSTTMKLGFEMWPAEGELAGLPKPLRAPALCILTTAAVPTDCERPTPLLKCLLQMLNARKTF